MATFRFPNQGQWRQINKGDILGEIWASRNIDLSSPGKIKLARPTELVATASTLQNESIEAIAFRNDKLYALTDEFLFEASSPYTSFSSSTSNVSGAEDMVTFLGSLRITTDTDIDEFSGSFTSNWWTTTGGDALSSSVPHNLHVSYSDIQTISVTDGSTLRYYNTSSGFTNLNMISHHVGICQASGIDFNWVGTYTETGDKAMVYAWRVGDDDFVDKYHVDAKAVLSLVTFGNVPIIVTERGEIQKFNGAGFSTVATFPMWNTQEFLANVETGTVVSSNTSRPIHPKGMQVVGDKILIYINSENTGLTQNVNERTPSGVWELDPSTGSLTHRLSVGGSSLIEKSSPLFIMNDSNGRVYFGGELDVLGSGDQEGLWREDLSNDAENYGYFVTTELYTDSVIDNFEKVVLSSLKASDDSIVIKYRTSRSLDLPIVVNASWLDTTSFTTTDDLSDVEVGNEVEIVSEQGGNRCVHITKIEGTNTYTVTVDEAVGAAGTFSHVQIDNWTKLPDVYDTNVASKLIAINKEAAWIQIKVYMIGKNGYPEINRMIVKSNNKQTL